MMSTPKAPMRPLQFIEHDEATSCSHAQSFHARMQTRRSVRHFRDEPIALDAVEACIAAAATAPSGANKQPWTFVLVTDSALKRQIREAAEEQERAFYGGRASAQWLRDLEPFDTGPDKPFLQHAPALIAVFAQRSSADGDDQHYYVQESVGIAVGILLTALHFAGFATLTHTPAPLSFLQQLLGRPKTERPFLLIPVGLPVVGCEVPDIQRKPLDKVLVRC